MTSKVVIVESSGSYESNYSSSKPQKLSADMKVMNHVDNHSNDMCQEWEQSILMICDAKMLGLLSLSPNIRSYS